MVFDDYLSPASEQLLQAARQRYLGDQTERRLLATEAGGAFVFFACAVPLAILASRGRSLDYPAIAAVVVVFLCALRVTFPVGSGETHPTQLAFIPMLFVLPPGTVPLIVAGCALVDLWPRAVRGRLTPAHALGRLGDSIYALGPALVLVLAGQHQFSWTEWPVLLAAFAAQIVFDCASGIVRTWFAERIRPSAQPEMLWIYVSDASLTCVGLFIAAAAFRQPALILLTLPIIALLELFARERHDRLDAILELSTAYRGTTMLLGDIVEADDKYTGTHSRDVVDLALAVADELELDANCRRNVEFSALLHDIGKIRLPKELINKPGRLDHSEWERVRRHTIDGEAMLKQVGGRLAGVGRIVRASHERWDGAGYPDGLVGEQIPIEARVVAACDAFSAMTTDRPYRPARDTTEALEELERGSGTQFDPIVGAILGRIVRRHLASRSHLHALERLYDQPAPDDPDGAGLPDAGAILTASRGCSSVG